MKKREKEEGEGGRVGKSDESNNMADISNNMADISTTWLTYPTTWLTYPTTLLTSAVQAHSTPRCSG